MTEKTESPQTGHTVQKNADRRAEALRENLKKRKAQQSARQDSAPERGVKTDMTFTENEKK